MGGLVLPLAFLVFGCTSAAPSRITGTAPPPAEKVAPPTTPLVCTDALRWVRGSAEYRAIAIQTYRAALAAAERLSAGKPPGSWAVSVDADETILDNSPYQKTLQDSRTRHSEAAWRDWLKRRERQALPCARSFLAGVRRLGGRIAVVTNTVESLCPDVAANLDAVSLPYDVILCRQDADR